MQAARTPAISATVTPVLMTSLDARLVPLASRPQRGHDATVLEDLLARAESLAGITTAELAARVGIASAGEAASTKGTAGAIVERALGATGAGKKHDFPDIGVELKTIPVDGHGRPVESTYVCTLSLADAEEQEWETSWVRAKLAKVLFVPLVGDDGVAWTSRRLGRPVLWSPTREQEAVLRADFDDVVGLVGVGRIEELTAHRGRYLQVRPKARDGSIRTVAFGAEGEAIATIPRGFYLRTKLTRAVLADPTALPD